MSCGRPEVWLEFERGFAEGDALGSDIAGQSLQRARIVRDSVIVPGAMTMKVTARSCRWHPRFSVMGAGVGTAVAP